MNSLSLQENTCIGVDQPPSRTQPDPAAAPLSLCPVTAKAVLMDFNGGRLSSDAGLLLLKEVDQRLGLTRERIRQVEVRGLLKLKMTAAGDGITPGT